jgi:DNA-directed RNA polymerase subunit M/transcription elongation factor TFIIS
MKKLKTLEKHNQDRIKVKKNLYKPRKNGIECPTCGKELYDTKPMQTLTSDPPQKVIHCKHCGYEGFRLE